jgi:hypothetical protein
MKKLLISMLSVLLLAACGSDDGGGNGGSFIPPSQNERNQTAYADNENTGGGGFTFTANAAWTATVTEVQPEAAVSPQALKVAKSSTAETGNNVVWLRLYVGDRESYSGPAGQTTLRIELDQNYTGERREATITIRSGNNTFTVTVVQEANKQDGSANVDPNPVTAVNVDKETLSLEVGGTTTLTATVTPADATIKSVKWSSSNPSVAEVHPVTGLVTAVGGGTSVVYATSSSNSGAADSCLVTVTDDGSASGDLRMVTAITETAQLSSDYYSEKNGRTYNPYNYEFKYDESNRLKEYYIYNGKDGSLFEKLMLDYSIKDEVKVSEDSYEYPWIFKLNAQGQVSEASTNDGYTWERISVEYDADGYISGATRESDMDSAETYNFEWADGNMVRWVCPTNEPEYNDDREGVSEFSPYLNNTLTSIDLNAFFFGLLENDDLFNSPNDDETNIVAMAGLFGKPSKNYMVARSWSTGAEMDNSPVMIYTESTLPQVGEVLSTYYDRKWYIKGEWTMDGDGFPVAFTRKVRVDKTERVYNGVKKQVYPESEYMVEEWLHMYGEGPYYTIEFDYPETVAYDTFTWKISYKK